MPNRIAAAARRIVGSVRKVEPDATDEPTISYAPNLDGDPDPGEVVWTWVAYEDDPTQGKDRPVLVIGSDGPLLAAVALTTKDHTDHPDSMPLGTGPWDRADRPSFVKLDRILRVDPAAVRREGAVLDRVRFDQVVARVAALHGWTPPGP